MDNIKDVNSILNDIQNECVLLYDNIRNHVFSDIDYCSIVGLVPIWIVMQVIVLNVVYLRSCLKN